MPDDASEVVDVSDWLFVKDEPGGRAEKLWLRPIDQPNVEENRWLFKPCHVHSNGTIQGTDWAEKASAMLADLLGVPHAEVELAQRDGVRGSISRNLRRVPFELQGGAVWLHAHPDVAYVAPSTSSSRRRRKGKGHTLENISLSLEGVGPAPGSDPAILRAYDGFVGLLLLDALISNQDRHETNWAILRPSIGDGAELLSPAYDNGSSLGFQLEDSKRIQILERDPLLASYSRRAVASRFDSGDAPTPTLVDFALHALHSASPGAQAFWAEKLENVTSTSVVAIVNGIPGMSDVERTFAITITTTNAERLRHGLHTGFAA